MKYRQDFYRVDSLGVNGDLSLVMVKMSKRGVKGTPQGQG